MRGTQAERESEIVRQIVLKIETQQEQDEIRGDLESGNMKSRSKHDGWSDTGKKSGIGDRTDEQDDHVEVPVPAHMNTLGEMARILFDREQQLVMRQTAFLEAGMEENRKEVAGAEASSGNGNDDSEIREARSSQVDTENQISELIAALQRQASSSSGGCIGAVAMDESVEAARNGDAASLNQSYHADEG